MRARTLAVLAAALALAKCSARDQAPPRIIPTESGQKAQDVPRVYEHALAPADRLGDADRLWEAGRWEEAIRLYMKIPAVRGILHGRARSVAYDADIEENDFEEVVLQRFREPGDRRPVLLLVGRETELSARRLAVLLRNGVREPRIDVVFLDADIDPRLRSEGRAELVRLAGVSVLPSLVLYAPGESGGDVARLDVWPAVPATDEAIPKLLDPLAYWLDGNVLLPGEVPAYRFGGEREWRRVR